MWQLVALLWNCAWAWACFAITFAIVVAAASFVVVVNINRIFDLRLSASLFEISNFNCSCFWPRAAHAFLSLFSSPPFGAFPPLFGN